MHKQKRGNTASNRKSKPPVKHVWNPILRQPIELTIERFTQTIPSTIQTSTLSHVNKEIINVNPCTTTQAHHDSAPFITHYQSIQECARLLQVKLFGPCSLTSGITAQ